MESSVGLWKGSPGWICLRGAGSLCYLGLAKLLQLQGHHCSNAPCDTEEDLTLLLCLTPVTPALPLLRVLGESAPSGRGKTSPCSVLTPHNPKCGAESGVCSPQPNAN